MMTDRRELTISLGETEENGGVLSKMLRKVKKDPAVCLGKLHNINTDVWQPTAEKPANE